MSTVIKRASGERQWFILYVLICLEIGVFLTLVPWSAIWERNYFLEAYPRVRWILLNPAFRGAVAGLGVANIYLGLREVLHRRRATTLPVGADLSPGSYRSKNEAGAVSSPESEHEASPGPTDAERVLASPEERR